MTTIMLEFGFLCIQPSDTIARQSLYANDDLRPALFNGTVRGTGRFYSSLSRLPSGFSIPWIYLGLSPDICCISLVRSS